MLIRNDDRPWLVSLLVTEAKAKRSQNQTGNPDEVKFKQGTLTLIAIMPAAKYICDSAPAPGRSMLSCSSEADEVQCGPATPAEKS